MNFAERQEERRQLAEAYARERSAREQAPRSTVLDELLGRVREARERGECIWHQSWTPRPPGPDGECGWCERPLGPG